MKKFTVIGIISASKVIGTYEAETKEEAIEKAMDDENADHYPSLCWQCSSEIDVGDIYDYEADEHEK